MLFLLTAIGMGISLVGVYIVQTVYIQQIQVPLCFDYARRMNVEEIDSLEFTSVTIASNHFHGHTCVFSHTRTNAPVILDFAPADIPTSTDTMQTMSTIGAFLMIGLLIFGALSPLFRRLRAVGN